MSLINEALKRAEAEKHGQAYQAPECGEGVSPSRPAGIPDRGPLGLPPPRPLFIPPLLTDGRTPQPEA